MSATLEQLLEQLAAARNTAEQLGDAGGARKERLSGLLRRAYASARKEGRG